MASRKGFLSRSNYIFPETPEIRFDHKSSGGVLEFDEADIWNVSSDMSESKKVGSGSRSGLKMPSRKVDGGGRVKPGGSASLPLNIPDWSKILKGEYKQHREKERDDDVDDEDDDDEDEEMKIPPRVSGEDQNGISVRSRRDWKDPQRPRPAQGQKCHLEESWV